MMLALINTGAWLAIHLVVVWAVTRLGADRLRLDGWLFRERRLEDGGAGLVNVALAALCHAPFIIVQRHNRFRLSRRLASTRRALALPAKHVEVMP